MVPAGSVLTYQAQVTTSGSFQTPDDVVQQMNQTLGQSNIAMRDYHVGSGILDTILSPINGKLQFQLTATLQTNVDFNAVDDVRSIADHGIYMATDALPVSTIPNITLPGSTTPGLTGQPGGATTPGPNISGIGDAITSALSGLQGTVMLVIFAILGVVFLLASKTKGISAAGATFR